MSTLFIRLPAKATFDLTTPMTMPDCRYALVSEQNRIERQGITLFSDLGAQITAAARVVLILAAADVNLLRMQVPPLSDAKLKMALPNLVEEQLLDDPLDCVLVTSRNRIRARNRSGNRVISQTKARPLSDSTPDNLCLIAVVQRDWLILIVKSLLALGASNLHVLPAQLCLSLGDPHPLVAAITDHGSVLDVALRRSAEEGIGWSFSSITSLSKEQEVLDSLAAVIFQQPLTLYVPEAMRRAFEKCDLMQVTVAVDDWSHWIAGAQQLMREGGIDLMSGLTASAAGTEFRWQRWRWPIVLATALLLVNIISLNMDWWHLRREASSLRTGMLQNYRAAYPKETVIVDPIAQMKQKIVAAERDNGRFANDDFIVLVAGFGEAWAALPQSADVKAITTLEYRDHHLLVRWKNLQSANPAEAQIKRVLDSRLLTLTRPADGAWQIGSRQ